MWVLSHAEAGKIVDAGTVVADVGGSVLAVYLHYTQTLYHLCPCPEFHLT